MTVYFSTGKLESFDAADAKCIESITHTNEQLSTLCSRVDKIETALPYTTRALEKNTLTIEKMAGDVQEIKVLLMTNIKKRELGGK